MYHVSIEFHYKSTNIVLSQELFSDNNNNLLFYPQKLQVQIQL